MQERPKPPASPDWPLTEFINDATTGVPPATISAEEHLKRLASAPKIDAVLLGRYRLVAVLGTGGMSVVYKALDQRRVEGRRRDQYVALKVLLLPQRDTTQALAFLQEEARKLEQLSHPGIVRVLDCDRDGDIVFMTMEYLSGGAVLGRTREHSAPLDDRQVRDIVAAVGSALSAAHAARLVHGDLKPGNVMLTATGEVKLIDFGIARAIGHAEHPDLPTDIMKGRALTPRYASPEMLEGSAPEPMDDVYALATFTYQLITGSHPFGGRDSLSARAAGVMVEPSPRLSRTEYAAIVRALAPDRAKRTATAGQFLREFESIRRTRLPWISAVAAGALVVVASAVLVLRQNDARSTARALPAPVVEARLAPALTPGQVFRDCPTCPLMMPLAAGEFLQGSAETDPLGMPSERPQHRVRLEQSFAMSVNEVTVSEYRQYRAGESGDAGLGCETYSGTWRLDHQASWQNPGFAQSGVDAVTCISWNDATDYASWLSARTGQRYRLPTASEWEYAARAGSERAHAWTEGGQTPCQVGNVADQSAGRIYPGFTAVDCNDNRPHTAPVGTYAANAFGLHDLTGNVLEWVADCWLPDYAEVPAAGVVRDSPGCTERELRGGSWFTQPAFLRPAYRNRFAAKHRASTTGIRVVREIGS